MKREAGFALLNSLPIVAALATLTVMILFWGVRTLRLKALVQTHERTAVETNSVLFNSDDSHQTEAPLRRALISFGGTPTATFPILDASSLFMNALPCTNPQLDHNRSARGFSLTPSALVAETTCDNGEIVRGNLAVPSIAPQGTSLVVLGYFEGQTVTVSHDLLIIAGGDIHINNLPGTGNIVTIVSSTGVVVVDAVSPTLTLQVLAKFGSYLPLGTINSPIDPNQLPLLFEEVLGIERD